MKRAKIEGHAKRAQSFKKGDPRPQGAGRKPGSVNKTTALLKDAIIMAASKVGSDGKGKDELVGYLMRVAKRNEAVFGRLLEKLLPYQLTGKDGGPMQVEHKTKEQLRERLKERGLVVPASLIDGPALSDSVN